MLNDSMIVSLQLHANNNGFKHTVNMKASLEECQVLHKYYSMFSLSDVVGICGMSVSTWETLSLLTYCITLEPGFTRHRYLTHLSKTSKHFYKITVNIGILIVLK